MLVPCSLGGAQGTKEPDRSLTANARFLRSFTIGGVVRLMCMAIKLTRRETIKLAGAMVTSVHGSAAAQLKLSTYEQAIDAAVSCAGGLTFVRRGDRVLLKVNSNSGDPSPYSSSPELVSHLVRRLRGLGARVVVGDRSFFGDQQTMKNLETNGIADAARRAGAEVVAFEDDSTDWCDLDPSQLPSWRPPIRVPRLAVEGHLINLACAKTHFISGCTLSLKNLLGLVRASDRARDGNLRFHHPERMHHQIAEINALLIPRLNIIDAWRALVSGGPTPRSGARPTVATPHLLFAGLDRIALDEQGITLLQRFAPPRELIHDYPPADHPTLVAARLRGVDLKAREEPAQ